LNASAFFNDNPVSGTFTYTQDNGTGISIGTVLSAGTHTLYVDFTPEDTVNYTTASKNVTINVSEKPVTPVADFSSNVTSGYAPLMVQFTDYSENATAWNWDFGDGTNSTQQSMMHTYFAVGNYTVNLTVSNENGTSSRFAIINVSEQLAPVLPVAGFSSHVTEGYAPLDVQFTDQSINANEWNWDFGDWSTSNEQNPMHTYSEPGSYTVNLIVSNANGTNSKSGTITVSMGSEPAHEIMSPSPVADFSANPTSGDAPLSIQFTDQSIYANEWSWDFGDGATSTEQNPTYTYSTPGSYIVSLSVTGSLGSDSKSYTIDVL
jgi:PKD repeat protein